MCPTTILLLLLLHSYPPPLLLVKLVWWWMADAFSVALDAYDERGACGFSFGNGCASHSNSDLDIFEAQSKPGKRVAKLFETYDAKD